ncbi:MAG: hypothetical protein HYT37_01100 [Candidatus Sungbacteria bacterium]|nr:hypothetical protein [Candidatus Sungbacteria bacterium]
MRLMQNTIDLRKPTAHPSSPEESSAQEAPVPDYAEALLSWTAPEFEKRIYTARWFFVVGGFALICIIAAIITKNYFFIVFIALSFLVTMLYTRQTPRDMAFAIAKEGVYIGRKVFLWKILKSFALMGRDGRSELSLETEKLLTPYIRIPLPEINIEELRVLLKKFIPEKEHPESAADELGKNLGF